MIIMTYHKASDFLLKTEKMLIQDEAANNLILGISLLLKNSPERSKSKPYWTTFEDMAGIILVAMMTPPHQLLVYSNRERVSEAAMLLVQDLHLNGWAVPGVLGAAKISEQVARAWQKVTGEGYAEGMRQRIYELREVKHPQSSPGDLRLATEDDRKLLTQWIYAFEKEALGVDNLINAHQAAKKKILYQEVYLWVDKEPVCMAGKSRPTPNGITINFVYTPPELRGRGYASSCVASLSQLQLDSGKQFCTLFTDLSNPTSNSIYQKMGYKPISDYNQYLFYKRSS